MTEFALFNDKPKSLIASALADRSLKPAATPCGPLCARQAVSR